ncbi:YidC/Oxa1 family membrane protein insertase [Singulisphaera sp. GP187]|uniref:membrane protein insertase YidC n=1 Tax=Singulisphaera sp. GP187 TaxID=1882752 RepID=UPI0009273C7C|nr:membrane protein insertase YidC [Singulisphaera sp. GP187]SIO45581.1 YidC/Oxa1 family membrane protein insertase [Singulisphaera sp. GP187]
MSNEKRLVLFMMLTFLSFLAIQYVMEATGLAPPPKKPQPKVEAKLDPTKPDVAVARKDETEKAKEKESKKEEKGADAAKPAEAPKVTRVPAAEMVIGSAADKAPGGYHLEVRFKQLGAGVTSIRSSQFDAELDTANPRRKQPRQPLELLRDKSMTLPSFALTVRSAKPPKAAATEELDEKAEAEAEALAARGETEATLGEILWEVVRDDQGRAVRPITKLNPLTKAQVDGQEIQFRTTAADPTVTVTKRFRLFKGEDAFSLTTDFESPEKEQEIVYRLFGPHGIPIEGEWYTSTFRDIFLGQRGAKDIHIETRAAQDIAKASTPFDNTTLPLAFAGIENQYFTIFVEPEGEPRINRTFATVIEAKPDALQKADISFEIVSNPIAVGPNHPASQSYTIYAGPKTKDALTPYGAEGLVAYRKYQWFGIPGASSMARYVIAPLLDYIYALTKQVAGFFGGKKGNYGIAIILLTLLVRMIMFPLGRKQALAAKKMQDLQPLLKEIQEKYKDDKERQTKETFALYKKHGVNPVGGCLPALIQLPIFVGLWQALNNSVHLRHAAFLYIQNLAAPDMLFKFPFAGGLPLLGEYFNLLPFLVVSLMLVQTKLFAPPATTPEAEMQQKMMKYMMIFMAFMFYKVPSGLGIYFITSSLWQISERLLLPKVTHKPPADLTGDDKNSPPGKGGGGNGGRGGPGGPAKPPGKFAQLLKRVMDEAAKDPTYRKLISEKDRAEKEKDQKDRGKPRAKPGRRR